MFNIFKKTLQKTIDSIRTVSPKRREKIDRDEIEEILISCDVTYELVEKIVDSLPEVVTRSRLDNELNNIFRGESFYDRLELKSVDAKPCVEIIIGVNGAGKTTTIAKLATMYKNEGKKVILGAGDTFRAAAIEQLKAWSEKIGVPIVYTKQGHDPSAVAYDTICSAISRNCTNVIIDTAGRLHNQTNLKNELEKIIRVCSKAFEGSPHRKYLVLDGTQGNSAIEQAKIFHQLLKVDGIIITKLDGTSKGGALFSIVDELRLPIAYIGTGEGAEDFSKFDQKAYIDSILDAVFIAENQEE